MSEPTCVWAGSKKPHIQCFCPQVKCFTNWFFMFSSPTERLLSLEATKKELEGGTAASRKGRSEACSNKREVTTPVYLQHYTSWFVHPFLVTGGPLIVRGGSLSISRPYRIRNLSSVFWVFDVPWIPPKSSRRHVLCNSIVHSTFNHSNMLYNFCRHCEKQHLCHLFSVDIIVQPVHFKGIHSFTFFPRVRWED